MSRKPCYIKEIVGNNVKNIRELKGYTQEDLSEIIGINSTALSDIERGKTYPKPETLEKIAETLNISFELLFMNDIISPDAVEDDFKKRIAALKQNPRKFTALYNYLTVLTSEPEISDRK